MPFNIAILPISLFGLTLWVNQFQMAILAKFDGINKKPAVTENAPQETAEIQQSHQSLTIDFEEKRPRKPTKLARVKEMDHNTCCLFFHVFNATVFVNCRTRVCDELHMDALLEAVLVLLTFVLTYCIGPLMLGLLSEMFKRATILHSGNSFYLIFNLVCEFARNKGEFLTSRLLSGIGGAGGLVVSMPYLLQPCHALMHQT